MWSIPHEYKLFLILFLFLFFLMRIEKNLPTKSVGSAQHQYHIQLPAQYLKMELLFGCMWVVYTDAKKTGHVYKFI